MITTMKQKKFTLVLMQRFVACSMTLLSISSRAVALDRMVFPGDARETATPKSQNIDSAKRPETGSNVVFREFTWTRSDRENRALLVFSPEAKRPKVEQWRQVRVERIQLDVARATRAEVVVEHWSGHIGTSKKRIRFNDRDWIELPLPEGTPGRPECYFAGIAQSAVEVPLKHLKNGINEFALTCGPQVCYNFDYPAFAVYGVTVRLYLEPSPEDPQGRIVAPLSGNEIGDDPKIEVDAQSTSSEIRRVDVIAEYEDFDWEGNGRFRQWHYDYDFTRLGHHVGTSHNAPHRVTWDTHWVPDQSLPIRLLARITDAKGVTYVTPIVDNLKLKRARSVRLYKASDVPERFNSRVGKPKHCTIVVSDDLAGATAARLVLATHGPQEEPGEFGLNDRCLGVVAAELQGRSFKRYQQVSVPPEVLVTGENRFYALSHTKAHALEVLWPGPVLLVEIPVVKTAGGTVGAPKKSERSSP